VIVPVANRLSRTPEKSLTLLKYMGLILRFWTDKTDRNNEGNDCLEALLVFAWGSAEDVAPKTKESG